MEVVEGGYLVPPDMLRDMRLVYKGEYAEIVTPGQKQLLVMFQNDTAGFLKMMHEQEKAFMLQQAKYDAVRPKEDKEEVDRGTERALAIVEDLLKKGPGK